MRRLSRYISRISLAGLLIGEVLGLTLAFDGEQLVQLHSVWAALVAAAPHYLRFAVASLVVTALVAGPQALKAFVDGPRWNRTRLPYLFAHASALALFVFLSARVFTGFNSFAHPAMWAGAWFAIGTLTLLFWALALFPLNHWLQSISRMRRSLVAGLAGGAGIWASGFASQELWIPLARYTFYVVGWILNLIYHNVVSDPAKLVVGTRTFKVNIAPECSGFEGIGLIVAFMTLYLWMSRKELRFPGALALVPIGVITIWLANSLRIVALVVIGNSGWPAVARGGFHSQAGWLTFNAVGLGLAAVTTRGGYFTSRSDDGVAVDDSVPAYVGPFAAVLATAMIAGAFSAGFDWLYPLRVFAAAGMLWIFRRHYRSLKWTWSPISIALGFAGFLAWLMLMPAGAPAGSSDWPSALGSVSRQAAALWLLMRLAGYVITIPIVEELAFRGFLIRRLIRVDFEKVPSGAFSWASFLLASVIFGAFHGRFWIPATAAGMIFALALYRKGLIADAVQAHATTNALIALYVFWTGKWFMWS